jgi:TldD protein
MERKNMMKKEDYFALGRTHWRRILDAALSRGGDFADLYFEHRVFHLIDIEEDIIKETAEAITLGLGIRVTRGPWSSSPATPWPNTQGGGNSATRAAGAGSALNTSAIP